ncbi:MAG: TetR/AcrR family transcriptional regulator [Nitrospira sp.]|jgi:TetR/AcrR family transcriptional repressor of nem operon|nr:TetR/AcrR family transcriptional regulator [Nitrospira sp.]
MPRPKEFNPDDALDHAMHVFWHKGYEATSMEDLLAAMHLNRGSLYDTFGGKRQLFVKALDRYCQGIVAPLFSRLTQPGPALPLLRQFIRGMIDGALADPQRRGCLLANTVMELAPHEGDIADQLKQALRMGEEALLSLLTRARNQGELSAEQDPRALAQFFTTMMQGLIVMIKSGAAKEAIVQAAEIGLRVVE